MHVESYLKHIGMVFVPSGATLFNLYDWLEYAWHRHCIAIVVLVFASIFVVVGIGCLVKGFLLTKKREDEEEKKRGVFL